MEYEVVMLKEKLVAGVKERTGNEDPGMFEKIGSLWNRFYSEGIYGAIPGKVNQNSIGLYSDYEDGVKGQYDVTVCCEIDGVTELAKEELEKNGISMKKIPEGAYAKFIVHGHVQEAVGKFWQELWGMDLKRAYRCDFEEYQNTGDMENAEIHMYISLQV